ncbi:hypothetical protein PHMEG_00019771, partial [Phytophthora megakarya]
MQQAPMATGSEAGVVDLLKRLHSHICNDSRNNLRRVLPVYQRLLSPREDASVAVQHELLGIRAMLLACGEDTDVVDVVDRMDRVVERCLSIQEQQNQCREAAGDWPVPMDEVMRLLVALAGGEDGQTFVLEDPMQTASGSSSKVRRDLLAISLHCVDCIVQRSRALFHKTPVTLQEKALFSQDLFGVFGNGISTQHTSLWCPENNISEDREVISMIPFKKPNQFFGLPGNPVTETDFDLGFMVSNNTPKHQRHGQLLIPNANTKTLKTMEYGKQTAHLSLRKEVFFYDGTQEVNFEEQIYEQEANWGEMSSITENSSWGSKSSVDDSELWITQTYAWENLGNREGLPDSYTKPIVRGQKRSLRDLVIPDMFTCRNYVGDAPLEIHEKDFIEDALQVLNGVESTIFRRDLQSATFQFPAIRRLKLPNTTISATKSVLEVFRKAGTIVMRLELLAIYYSQNPARGGKTLQAMGDALQLYLSTHRICIEGIVQQHLESYGNTNQEDEIISVTKLVGTTRKTCRVLDFIGDVFGCNDDAFWPLLQKGTFPRGVALLNHLHHHVSSLWVEDSSGCMHQLVKWFLVKSCSPLLAVLSDLISLGRVDESTDPFDEFEVTVWSRNFQVKTDTGGGDGFFSEGQSAEMLPNFLEEIAPLIIHLSHVQALLRNMNSIAVIHPMVNMLPLVMITHADGAIRYAEDWKSTIGEPMASTRNTQCLDDSDTHKSISEDILPVGEVSRRYMFYENTEAKRNSQLQQRSMLDQQVLENRQHQLQLARQEKADEIKRIDEVETSHAGQVAYGREVLFKKYSLLMNGAKERHDYMKWRRDRALRISNAKEQLKSLHASDTIAWTADMGKESNDKSKRAPEGESVNFPTEEGGDSPPGSTCIDASMPASTASVEASKESENCVFASTDECGWRTTERGNKEAGSRTSGSTDENGWRASVKVNIEAGRRTSGVLNDPASTEVVLRKTGIRILNEPGGSGADVHRTLYGGSMELPNKCVQPEAKADSTAASATDDVEMEDCNGSVEQSASMDGGATPCVSFSEIDEAEVQDSTKDGEEVTTRNDQSEELSYASGNAGNTKKHMRVSLHPVHEFFTTIVSQEDSEVLISTLTETTSAVEFTSFTSIIDCCVKTPVRLVAEKLEQVALDWFRNSLDVLEHLRWLQKLMLMSEGLCMDVFARDFLHGLNSATRVNWGLKGRLSSALSLAMIEGSMKLDAISQNFHYETTLCLSQVLDSLTMTPAVPRVLDEIELVYDVKWPLGLVITSQSLDEYKKIHRFLLHRLLPPKLERLCGNVIYKMQTFVRAYNETFSTKVLMAAWSDLEHESQKAATLIELRHCHEKYVSIAVRSCFLDRPVLATQSAFLDTLAATWSLTEFVRALDRQVASRVSDETRVLTLCDTINMALRELVGSLQSVNRDAERDTREFSECVLLRLNFNQFYCGNDTR